MIQDPIYERAYSSYLEGDYESALNDIGICIQKYRKSTYHQRSTKNELYTNLVFAKLLEGKILLASGRISEAEDVYSQLKGELIGSDKTTTGLKGQLYSYLAEIAKSQQKWKDYLKHVLQAKEHLLAADNYSETVDLLFTMEDYFSQKGDDDRLIDLYQQILQTNKSIQSKELRRINSAKVRYQIGKILQRTDLKQATKSLQQAHKDYSKLNFPEMKAKTLIEIAKMKSYENPKDGLKLLKKSQNEFKNLEALEPIISIRMAISYLEMGKQEDAFKIGNHILNDVKKADVSKEYVDNLLDFVKVLILQGNSKDIMNLATKGAQIAGEIYDAHDNREGKIMSSVFDEIAVYIRDGRQSDDSKLKLIQILSKKYLGDEINNFRPRTIQILSWVSKVDSGVKAEEIYSEIISKKHQFHDIEIAQILYILGFYQLSKSLQEEGQQYLKKSKVHFENLRIKNYSFETALSTINDQLDNGM